MPAITALPPVPTRADPTNFAAKADALLTALEDPFVPELNALSDDVTAKSDQVALDLVATTNAKDAALASSNFKGAWSSLTGALNIPASVSHSGKIWLLNANLADVTTATPGVSGSWLDITNFLNGITTAVAARAALDVYSKSEAQSLATNLIDNSNFAINQRGVSGTVNLAAGVYGHDRWKGGASGGTYTFATSGGITTITISAGSLVQVVEGVNLETATYTLSQGGAAQMRVVGGSYAVGPITVSATAGTNLSLEFGTGTVKQVKLEKGSAATTWVMPNVQAEDLKCAAYQQLILTGAGSQETLSMVAANSTTTAVAAVYLPVKMKTAPTLTFLSGSATSLAIGTPVSGTVSTLAVVAVSNGTVVRLDITGTGFTIGTSILRQNSGTPKILLSANL